MDRLSRRERGHRAPDRGGIGLCIGVQLAVVEVPVGWPAHGNSAASMGKGAPNVAPHRTCRVLLSTWSKSATLVGAIGLRCAAP